jgi:tetratricopeptide (TPR) repeat protein
MKDIFNKILKLGLSWKLLIANWKLMNDQPEEAIPILKKLHEKHPDNGPVLAMIGMAHIKKGEFENGIKALEGSLKLLNADDRHIPEIYSYLGYGYLVVEEIEKAIEYNKAALNNWNDDNIEFSQENIYENLGLSYEKNNETDLAIEAYNKGLKTNPNDISLYERLIRIYSICRMYNEAKHKLRQLLRIEPTLEENDSVKQYLSLIEKGLDDNGEIEDPSKSLAKILSIDSKRESHESK